MTKKGLGQGLSVLLGEEFSSGEQSEPIGTKEILVDRLSPGSFQPREDFEEQDILELATSIKENGVIQPILVRQKNADQYEIIAGERRWRAAQHAGLKRIPVIEKFITDEEALTIALVENIQREDLNPMEEARAYERIIDRLNYTQERLAEVVGKSRTHITNILRLNQLPSKVKDHVKKARISMGHAKILVGVEGAESVADLIIQKNLNVRQTEKLVQKLKSIKNVDLLSEKIPEQKKNENLMKALLCSDEEAIRIQRFIEEIMHFKTTVQIKGENNIMISFQLKSIDELDVFMAKINNSFT